LQKLAEECASVDETLNRFHHQVVGAADAYHGNTERSSGE